MIGLNVPALVGVVEVLIQGIPVLYIEALLAILDHGTSYSALLLFQVKDLVQPIIEEIHHCQRTPLAIDLHH